MVHRLLHLGDALDVPEFGLGPHDVLVTAPAQSTENVPRLLLATDLDEPSRRLGEEPNDDEEQDQEDDLEGDRESPSEGGLSAVDEG